MGQRTLRGRTEDICRVSYKHLNEVDTLPNISGKKSASAVPQNEKHGHIVTVSPLHQFHKSQDILHICQT